MTPVGRLYAGWEFRVHPYPARFSVWSVAEFHLRLNADAGRLAWWVCCPDVVYLVAVIFKSSGYLAFLFSACADEHGGYVGVVAKYGTAGLQGDYSVLVEHANQVPHVRVWIGVWTVLLGRMGLQGLAVCSRVYAWTCNRVYAYTGVCGYVSPRCWPVQVVCWRWCSCLRLAHSMAILWMMELA